MEKLLNVKEAAAYLGLSAYTLREKAAAGAVPKVVLWKGKMQSTLRFSEAALAEFIEERSVPVS